MNVLIVAAHPDDEVLGCGGTMAWHAARGDEVAVLILAEGATSRAGTSPKEGKRAVSALAQAARRASESLGAKRVELLGFPDNRMDTVSRLEIVQAVERHVESWRPEIVYTHHSGDLNVDHQIAHESVATACRPSPGQYVKRILCFEVPSSTEWRLPGSSAAFQPNWFVDITPHLDSKLSALREYETEMRPWPHARSIEAITHLARWRGPSAGLEAAEAFMLARSIEVSAARQAKTGRT